MDDVIIRPAGIKDIDAMAALDKVCFADPWSRESFESEFKSNIAAFYLVAQVDNRIVGYAGLWNIVNEGHITNIAVDPDFRRRGIGAKLLGLLIDTSIATGIGSFTLEVREGNEPAKALYAGFGFEERGLRKGYYHDNGENAIIMWKY